ncbi:MAG: nitrile hydratase accessory protein [Anaerolineae bacterium]|nr:nitrile hydratase accessory protein [Anaerolineae bacterium]
MMAESVDKQIAIMDEQIALPRKNGELVFEAPWEARAFGLAVALSESGVYAWHDFSQGLAAEIADAEREGIESSYYERWLASLEKLVIAAGLVTREELDAQTAQQALDDEHDHDHGHHHHHDDHDHPHDDRHIH